MGNADRTRDRLPAAHVVADAGHMIEQRTPLERGQTLAVVVSRLGGVRHSARAFAFWLQLRGTASIEASEGRFLLQRGDWMMFDPESQQEVLAMRGGLAVGLLLPRGFPLPDGALVPGAGRARRADIRIALNLWRRCAGNALADGDGAGAMQPLLLHLQSLQASLHERADRCPGRTDVRRRQVLARMQRVHMCMQGNTHRSVRLAELAEMTRFSEWWVSKTYRAIYGETVQEASLRLRLRRACALLEHSGLSISEVGEACGFHDPCSFARLFKRRHGQTASRWRETGQAWRQTGPRQSPDFPPVVGRMGA